MRYLVILSLVLNLLLMGLVFRNRVESLRYDRDIWAYLYKDNKQNNTLWEMQYKINTDVFKITANKETGE